LRRSCLAEFAAGTESQTGRHGAVNHEKAGTNTHRSSVPAGEQSAHPWPDGAAQWRNALRLLRPTRRALRARHRWPLDRNGLADFETHQVFSDLERAIIVLLRMAHDVGRFARLIIPYVDVYT